jgi:phage gpG-like protein
MEDLEARLRLAITRSLYDIRVELLDQFNLNFRRQGFFTEAWQKKKRDDGHPILIRTGELRRSIVGRVNTGDNSVSFGSPEVYAAIHNEGGTIQRRNITITMPRRQFVGWDPSLLPILEQIVQKQFNHYLSGINIVLN